MKLRNLGVALIAALSLVSVSAQAGWVQVNERQAYNTERIVINGSTRTAFVRISNSSGSEVMGTHYDYMISRVVYDCSRWTSATQSITAYTSDGTVVANFTYQPYEMVVRPIMPDSYGEDPAKAVCAIN